ncbi:MAG: TonB-dependent receptor [Rhodospirillaceae bacterium]|jgi:iron complex outermembrane recepter protein|nr:TonB-dependent receptor [Rhodospirillaceae bacterium]
MKKCLMTATSILALSILFTSAPALAQSGLAIEEIVVTAERRSSTLQSTPISITAVTGETLSASAVFDSEAFSYSVPGLVIQRDVIGKATIRGIGTENFTVGGDPGVAMYLDGAYVARSSVAILDFFDTERVEVLRGPQGTLYGRNATGGVINIISKAPTEEFEGYAKATYGNYDNFRLEGAVSGPITESARVRLAGFVANRDGYTENIFPGADARGLGDLDSKDLWALRGRFDLDVTEKLSIELIGDIYRDDSNPPAFWYTDDTLPWQGPASVFPSDIRTVSQGFEFEAPLFDSIAPTTAGRWDQTGITGKITYEADAFTVTSTSAYRDIEFEWLNDGDGLSDFLVVYYQKDFSDQFTQDIQITSNDDGPFNWIVGGFYLTESATGLYAIPLGPAFGGITLAYDGNNETDAFGVFAEGTYEFGNGFRFTGGLRYSDEQKDATADFRVFDGDPGFPQTPEVSSDAFTPRFVLDYTFDDDTMVYASATRGFRSGGFSFLDIPVNAFEAETIWAYEVGTKANLADDRVQLNAAGFYYNYKNQQLSQVTNLSTTTSNAGSSTIWGLEFELAALISENLRLDGSLAYLNAEFDEFCTNDGRDLTRPIDNTVCPGTPNLAGNKLPRAPDWTGNLALSYVQPLGDSGDVDARIEWQYTGDQFYSVFNRDSVSQNGVSVFNASIGFVTDDERWSIRGWVRNIGDKEYFSNLFPSGVSGTTTVPQGFVAPPRTYGVTVGANF